MVMEINRKGGAVGSKERDRVRERSRECGKLGIELGNIYIYLASGRGWFRTDRGGGWRWLRGQVVIRAKAAHLLGFSI